MLGLEPGSPEARLAADGLLSLLRGLALGAVLRPHGDSERAALTARLASFDATPSPLPDRTVRGAAPRASG